MQLHELKLSGLRHYREAVLRFHPQLTLLFGANGSGKTTLLWATAAVLRANSDGSLAPGPLTAPTTYDLRRTAAGQIEEESGSISLSLTREDRKRPDRLLLTRWIDGRLELKKLESTKGLRPVAFYGAFRRWSPPISQPRAEATPVEGPPYVEDDWWNAGFSTDGLLEWWRQADHRRRFGDEVPELGVVEAAVARAYSWLFPDRSRPTRTELPFYNPNRHDLEWAVPESPPQFLSTLSDGTRGLLALVADVARRVVASSPSAPSLQAARGLVMIDEIDLHLHPRWQRQALPMLLSVFPSLQWVVTTHSPQVLGSVPGECVRELDQDGLPQPVPTQTRGRSSGWILPVLMGDPGRDPSIDEKLQAIEQCFAQGALDEAEQRWEALHQEVGDDPDLLALRWLLGPKANGTSHEED